MTKETNLNYISTNFLILIALPLIVGIFLSMTHFYLHNAYPEGTDIFILNTPINKSFFIYRFILDIIWVVFALIYTLFSVSLTLKIITILANSFTYIKKNIVIIRIASLMAIFAILLAGLYFFLQAPFPIQVIDSLITLITMSIIIETFKIFADSSTRPQKLAELYTFLCKGIKPIQVAVYSILTVITLIQAASTAGKEQGLGQIVVSTPQGTYQYTGQSHSHYYVLDCSQPLIKGRTIPFSEDIAIFIKEKSLCSTKREKPNS